MTSGSKRRSSVNLPGQQFGYTFDAIGNRTGTTREGRSTSYYTNSNNAYVYLPSYGGTVDILGEADPSATVTVNGQAATRVGSHFHRAVSNGSAAWLTMTVQEQLSGQPPVEATGKVWVDPATVTPTHDWDGNLTQDGRWNYTWDAENRLIKQEIRYQESNAIAGLPIQRLEYQYDAYWRRVEKKLSTYTNSTWTVTKVTKYAYDGWNLIGEWESPTGANGSFALARTHYWGTDLSGTQQGAGGVGGLVLTRHHNSASEVRSYVPGYDGTGNVLALYDTINGALGAKYEYGPFGESLRATGAAAKANPIRWSTKVTDDENGSVWFGVRVLQSTVGRWLSRDPIHEKGGLNLYAYVNNASTGYVDGLGDRPLRVDDDPRSDSFRGKPVPIAPLPPLPNPTINSRRWGKRGFETIAVRTKDCSQTQTNVLLNAGTAAAQKIAAAASALSEAMDPAGSPGNVSGLAQWFGMLSPVEMGYLKNQLNLMEDALSLPSILEFTCVKCCKQSAMAYTKKGEGDVKFCPDFFESGGFAQVNTVIHELSHRYAWTHDHGYVNTVNPITYMNEKFQPKDVPRGDLMDNADTISNWLNYEF